ncbi:precorrin-3B synthase [Calothrix sp. UHCC 0171]|uniref:precorrin-3B synthase n=1 Tax=Calothrix sp. UHCC 0171 TaxID=3110245 RepID=UPI002B206A25|nr:precorrin-3B synthase [Calothrix sp. UHCC 0171]MEA5571540.1 precorrin-3B synthase [Calothrix sp. UHCC 0171]
MSLPLPSNFVSCPGLFYPTSARDGILSRIRIPGGIITSQQLRAIANLADKFGNGSINITNRANIQLREITRDIPADVLALLQEIGLAARLPELDHLRNIMGSPTAGIDHSELIDTRPLMRELEYQMMAHADLVELSPKFSVCFDGGGSVSVATQANDIALIAVFIAGEVYFRLKLRVNADMDASYPFLDTGVILKPEESVSVVVGLAKVYLQNLLKNKSQNQSSISLNLYRKSHQPRLRDILDELGVAQFIQEVEFYLNRRLRRISLENNQDFQNHQTHQNHYLHLDIHHQKQKGFAYIGIVTPLGKLETKQIYELANIAQTHGDGTLRLTPWQNLIISDIPIQYIQEVSSKIRHLKLDYSVNNIYSALVACTGNAGCASSATDTKSHAVLLAEYLNRRITLPTPVNIHFTGCPKSCAQAAKGDITLLGMIREQEGGYQVYLGKGDNRFGRMIYDFLPFVEIPALLEKILLVYMAKSTYLNESFADFVNRYSLKQLQSMFE